MRAQAGPFQVGDPGVGVALVYGWSCDNPTLLINFLLQGKLNPLRLV